MVEVGKAKAYLLLDTKGFSKGISDAEGQLGRFQKKSGIMSKAVGGIAKAAKVGAAVVGTAFTAMAVSSVKTGMKFDKAMSQVAATMGKSADDIKKLRDFALEMGEKTKFSATEAADALNYMALAGYDSKKSMEMLPKVLNLAAAGNIDLAKASDMVTDTQTAFGISMKRTGQMVDEMAKAASTGNTSVEQLGDAFLTVGGLAKELNGGMVKLKDGSTKSVDGVQELEIALTAMANAGVKGSEAGTHMRNMLLKLSSPTKGGAEAFKKLGVSVFDSEGKMRSLQDIFGDLNKSMSNLTQQEKLQAISDIFNTRDTASAEALLASIEQDWNGIGESILNAKGAAQKMADTQLDNLAGDVTLAKSAFETLQIAISDVAKGPLRNFVQLGTKGIKEVTKAVKTGDMEGLFKSMGKGLASARDSILKELPNIVKSGADIAVGLSDSFAKSLPKTLSSIVDTAFQIGDTLISTLKDVIGKVDIPSVMSKSLDIVGGLAKTIREKAGTLVDSGLELIVNLAKGFADSMPTLIEKVPTIISNIAGIINDNAPKLLAAGAKIIATLAIGIVKAIPTLIANFPKILKAIWDVITAFQWLNLGKTIIKGIGKGITALKDHAPKLMDKIGEKIVTVLKKVPNKLLSLGKSMIKSLVNGIKSLFSTVTSNSANIGKLILDALKSIPSKLLSLGVKMIKFLVTGIKTTASLVVSGVKNLGSKIISAFKELPSKVKSIGKNIVEGLWKGIKNNWASVISGIGKLGKGIVNKLKSVLDIHSPSRVMEKQVGWNIVEGLVKGIKGKSKKAIKEAGGLAQAIVDAATKKLDKIKTYNGISEAAEMNYWRKVVLSTKKGTEAHLQAYKNWKDAKQNYYDQMKAAEEEYQEQSTTLLEELQNKVDELNKQYEDAVKERANAILSATSLFQKYTQETEEGLASSTLIDNLQSQVDAIRNYNQAISELEGKSVLPKELIDEIKDMGLSASQQISVLNSMSADELQKYADLYKEKMALATEQAEKELAPLKDSTAKTIEEATATTTDKLEELKKAYEKKLKKLGTDGKTVGKKAGKKTIEGLIQGLYAKRSELKSALDLVYADVKSKVDEINKLLSSTGDSSDSKKPKKKKGGNSHRDGLTYVPYNGYSAQLHEGEMVLTRNEAEAYKKGKTGSYNFTFNSPKAIDPYEANKLFKETVRKMNEGFA